MDKELKNRIKKAVIVLSVTLFVSTVIIGGYPAFMIIKHRIKKQENISDKSYCIFKYDINSLRQFNRDNNIEDGCSSVITFKDDKVSFPYNDRIITANYKIDIESKLVIYNCDTLGTVFDSKYHLGITDHGINIFNDSVEILAKNYNKQLKKLK